MTLYEIDDRITEVLRIQEEQGLSDDDIRDTLETLLMDKYDKSVNVALYIKNMMQDLEAYKKEEERLKVKKQRIENKISWFKDYLSVSLEGATIEHDPRVSVTYRSSEKVEIDDPDLIPDEYMRIPDIKFEASKKDIKEALKKGLEVPGAHLESCSNIQIN